MSARGGLAHHALPVVASCEEDGEVEATAEVKRIFVSHCQADRDFCARLVMALREAGAEVWWDEPSKGITEESERELSERPIFVAVLSEAAFASETVAHQTFRAVELYHLHPKRIVVPLNAHPIHYFNTWHYLDNFDRLEASERSLAVLSGLIIQGGAWGNGPSGNQAGTEQPSVPPIVASSPYSGLLRREAQGALLPTALSFNPLTREACDVITLAEAEAQRRHLAWLSTEHLLLGILGTQNGGALEALCNLGMDLDDVRFRTQSVPSRDGRRAGKNLFSANAKRAIQLAAKEAHTAGHHHVGTVHLLLGLIAEGRGTASKVLSNTGITLGGVREEMHRLLR
jgi:hypothetical protein